MAVNKVIIVGNVGADPVIRKAQDGTSIATFSVATSDRWKDRASGEYREKTEWHRIVVFGDSLSNIVEKYVKKGTRVFVEGKLETRKWTDKNSNENYTTEIVLRGFNNKLEILDSKKDGESNGNHESSNYDDSSIENIADDDIPF